MMIEYVIMLTNESGNGGGVPKSFLYLYGDAQG